MSCVITYKGNKYTKEQFKEYISSNKNEFSHIIASNENVIDSFKRKMEGIDYVFSQSPELALIGSKAQYLQYLSTIFKTSKVKDIVYHGSDTLFERFSKNELGRTTGADSAKKGFFFGSNRLNSTQYGTEGSENLIKNLKEVLKSVEKINSIKDITPQLYRVLGGKSRIEELIKYFKKSSMQKYNIYDIKNNLYTYSEFFNDAVDGYYVTLEEGYDNNGRIIFNTEKEAIDYFTNIKNEGEEIDEHEIESIVINHLYGEIESKIDKLQFQDDLDSRDRGIKQNNILYSVILNMQNPLVKDDLNFEARTLTFSKVIDNALTLNNDSVCITNTTDPFPTNVFVVFEPEQIHILGSKQDIEGFKNWVDNNQSNAQYQLPQNRELEEFVASEKTIRDLAARMSNRIGIPVRFESDRTKKYKGKIENGTAYINLAYATLDTPIHEILGHPIVRALKNNTNQLYQNLLKELEYGKGAEVLDRIKRDYTIKTPVTLLDQFNPKNYTLEEQQEEAIVELLGLMTAEKLDNAKDGKLISLLKRLLKEMKQFVRSLINQKEVEIDKLPDNMTLGDIADLLAYSNSKLILPGNEVIYTTPDNQQFKTYQEASNHISELARNVEDVDLSNIKVNVEISKQQENINNLSKKINDLEEKIKNFIFEKIPFNNQIDIYTLKGRLRQNYWARNEDGSTGYLGGSPETLIEPEYDGFVIGDYDRDTKESVYKKISNEEAKKIFDNINDVSNATKKSKDEYNNLSQELFLTEIKLKELKTGSPINNFIDKNKEYEQSKEIIEEWKKVNNIQYNPEEIYSRGQEFTSVVGAYSNFDVNLMMQNLLSHIEDNEKAGGKFAISAYTKPIDKQIGHLEGGGGKIKFKINPQSEDILWASNIDVYSGSVWDASEKVNKDKKSELLGVSYTKYPSLSNVNTVQPNLASIVDNLNHHHNELGIVLTGNNFRLEYDEDIPYTTKKVIDGINKILDQKYGKLVKPEIIKPNSKPVYQIYDMWNLQEDGDPRLVKNFENESEAKQFIKDNQDVSDYAGDKYSLQVNKKAIGIQPTQTIDTLKESIDKVKTNLIIKKNRELNPEKLKELEEELFGIEFERNNPWSSSELTGIQKNRIEEINKEIKTIKENLPKQKEYTDQALINTKISRLKEVAKKYPRSLIRSEVRSISQFGDTQQYEMFDVDELPFQKVSSNSSQQIQQDFNTPTDIDNFAEEAFKCK